MSTYTSVFNASVTIKCVNNDLAVPFLSLYMASSVVRNATVGCDSPSNLTFGPIEVEADTVRMVLSYVGKEDALRGHAVQKEMLNAIQQQRLVCANIDYSVAYEVTSRLTSDLSALCNPHDLGDVAILTPQHVADVFKVIRFLGLDNLRDALQRVVNADPTVHAIWAIDTTHPADASWASHNVMKALCVALKDVEDVTANYEGREQLQDLSKAMLLRLAHHATQAVKQLETGQREYYFSPDEDDAPIYRTV